MSGTASSLALLARVECLDGPALVAVSWVAIVSERFSALRMLALRRLVSFIVPGDGEMGRWGACDGLLGCMPCLFCPYLGELPSFKSFRGLRANMRAGGQLLP